MRVRPARNAPSLTTPGRHPTPSAPLTRADGSTSLGRPLDEPVRSRFEQCFDHDFSQVRIHTDPAATATADRWDAAAFTQRNHVVFGHGRYEPATAAGERLLAHELAHVVQQSAASECPPASAIQRQARGDRGADVDRQQGRETRTERAHEDDSRRGRPAGGSSRRSRRRDPFSDFESDWAGRALLERYLSGEGAWDITDDPRWTDYMKASRRLRTRLQTEVITEARRLAAVPADGTFPVSMRFHADIENGEGIIGYQYLHGTNADVGDFTVSGVAEVQHQYGQSLPGADRSVEPGATVVARLHFVWNDMIDPNPQYGTDTVKSTIAEIITLGEATGYRFSVGWTSDCTVWIPELGDAAAAGYPGD